MQAETTLNLSILCVKTTQYTGILICASDNNTVISKRYDTLVRLIYKNVVGWFHTINVKIKFAKMILRFSLSIAVISVCVFRVSCLDDTLNKRRVIQKTKCPKVNSYRLYDLEQVSSFRNFEVSQGRTDSRLKIEINKKSIHQLFEFGEISIKIRALRILQVQGSWYVIKYYASSEESEIYRCMRTIFSLSADLPEISMNMNFTFTFKDDPDNEHLCGNITWRIPDSQRPSHWVHSENICEYAYS